MCTTNNWIKFNQKLKISIFLILEIQHYRFGDNNSPIENNKTLSINGDR